MTGRISHIITCPICNSQRNKFLFSAPDHRFLTSDELFNIYKCRHCGFGFLFPRLPDEQTAAFYPQVFYNNNSLESIALQRQAPKYAWIAERPPGRLLDVGCAGGEFLNYARKFGWDVQGYEWSELPNNRYEAPIISGVPLNGVFQENTFDLITLWAVLEHVMSPMVMLKELHRILKPGGAIIILVTNLYSIPAWFMRKDDIPRHVNIFSKHSLSLALAANNFIINRWSFDNKIFNSSHRGLLVYLYKYLRGESFLDVRGQHTSPGRRHEFCTMLKGRPSKFVKNLCDFDRSLSPFIDAMANYFKLGHIMTVQASKKYGRGSE